MKQNSDPPRARAWDAWLIAAAALLAALNMMSAHGAEPISVFAAASLKDALDEIGKDYETAGGEKIVVSYAASSALAKQIENGAPADVFISADTDWMDYLQQRNLVKSESRRNLLRNRLVLIAPAQSNVTVSIRHGFAVATLLGDGRLAMANPDAVPAGKYGKTSLEALGVWEEVQGRVAPAENVRAALTLVARGEAPLGIVYRTDALAERKVKIIGEFPENTHAPIIYPAALTAASKPAAAAFLKALSEHGPRAVFAKYGFY
jgi:molybdate transport system substrate-binding protein